MGRKKGSKNKPKEPTSIVVATPEKPKQQQRASKTDGFIHGPCGQFWPMGQPTCPTCN